LSADSIPSVREDIGYSSILSASYTNANGVEQARRFRPSHSHFLPGDLFIPGYIRNGVDALTWITRFRIAGPDTANTPNSLNVLVNIDFPPDVFDFSTTLDESKIRLANTQTFYDGGNIKIDSFNLDTTKDYWLILSNDNHPTTVPTRGFIWGANQNAVGTRASVTVGGSTNSSSGGGWTTSTTQMPLFGMPRRRSQAFECADPKAIASIGSGLPTVGGTPIESTLSNIPSSVTTKEAMQKYLVNQSYYMARPQVLWPTFRVSVPNLPILPNDPLMIVDSTLLFSTAGTQVVTATTGAMTYEFGTRGGTGNSISSALYLNITPVGFANHY
jgi:hypothetical protein